MFLIKFSYQPSSPQILIPPPFLISTNCQKNIQKRMDVLIGCINMWLMVMRLISGLESVDDILFYLSDAD